MMVVVDALQVVEIGVLRQSGSLVVVGLRVAIWLLELVLALDDQVVVLARDGDLGWLDVLRQCQAERDVLGTILAIDDLGEQGLVDLVGRQTVILEWDLNHQVTMAGHEADHVLLVDLLGQVVGLVELLH